jgi:hypothetical protein
MAFHSEIGRLLAQIDAEVEAAQQGLYGIAITAPHYVIEARMEQIAQRHMESLITLFHEQETLVATKDKVPSTSP